MPLLTFDAVRPATVEYNMPDYDRYITELRAYKDLWKATHITKGQEQIQIRKQMTNADLSIVVYKDNDLVSMSANGTVLLSRQDMEEIAQVVREANEILEKKL